MYSIENKMSEPTYSISLTSEQWGWIRGAQWDKEDQSIANEIDRQEKLLTKRKRVVDKEKMSLKKQNLQLQKQNEQMKQQIDKGVYISCEQWHDLNWRIGFFDYDPDEVPHDERIRYEATMTNLRSKFNKKTVAPIKNLQVLHLKEENEKLKQQIDKQHQELQEIKTKLNEILALH